MKLRPAPRGYASLDYEVKEFEIGPLVKLDILVHHEPVDALSVIVHRERAFGLGQKLTSKLNLKGKGKCAEKGKDKHAGSS